MKDYHQNYAQNTNLQPKKRIYRDFQLPIYVLIQIFFFFFFIFLTIFQNVRYKDLEKKFHQQIQENRTLNESILPVQLQVRNLTRNEILEELAKKKYFLKPATKDQIIQVEYLK
jgi:cell division protein FtsB